MARSRWLCTRNMPVKIVHPGGHVELHDRPVLAAEIMLRNPRCCIAHPHVFKQPWAIVSPDTTLMLGQKFYVVPVSTIRKLQRHSLNLNRSSPNSSSSSSLSSDMNQTPINLNDEDRASSMCWFFKKKPIEGGSSKKSKDDCFARLTTSKKVKAGNEVSSSSSETQQPNGRYRPGPVQRRSSSNRRASFEQWQPSLHSISEE